MGIFKAKGRLCPVENEIYLKKVTVSNGETLSFSPGDIVLIVGPNNSGKSTFLRNISDFLYNSATERKMLREVDFVLPLAAVQQRLKDVYRVEESDGSLIIFDQRGQYDHMIMEHQMQGPELSLNKFCAAFATTLNAETRLSLSKPTNTFDIAVGRPSHPFHHFMMRRDTLRRFADIVKNAFGLDFTIIRIGNPIRGFVGPRFHNDDDSLEGDKAIPSLGEPVELQGDGIRSYTGIAAEIIGAPPPVTLLDEPEAFLHPPQARKLGRLLLDVLPPDRQAFVATHSSDFLQGALFSKSSRVRVVRLDRGGGALRLNALSNDELAAAIAHPSIANTNLLDSLFFSQTVICEGDSDCSLFDWIVRELGDDEVQSVDRFWFSTGGKDQMPKIAELLARFGVDFRVVLDLDAIADWGLLSRLCSLKSLDISSFERRISAALSALQRPAVGAISGEIRGLLERSTPSNEREEKQLLREIQRAAEKSRRSHPLKQYGLAAFRHGQERSDVEQFLATLRACGIALLPQGEIESYVPEVGLHGPGWASAVINDLRGHEQNLRRLLSDITAAIMPA